MSTFFPYTLDVLNHGSVVQDLLEPLGRIQLIHTGLCVWKPGVDLNKEHAQSRGL